VLTCLSVWSEVQTCIRPSCCHCHSLSLASVKSRLVFTFLVPARPGGRGQRAVKGPGVCVNERGLTNRCNVVANQTASRESRKSVDVVQTAGEVQATARTGTSCHVN